MERACVTLRKLPLVYCDESFPPEVRVLTPLPRAQ